MKFYAPKYKQLDLGLLRSSSKMLDGNVLLRQECDEVPEGTLSCPGRNMEVFNQLRHYEGLRLLPSVCGRKLIQHTLSGIWESYGEAAENTPVYFGLMAIAGAYMLKNSLRYLFLKEEKTEETTKQTTKQQ